LSNRSFQLAFYDEYIANSTNRLFGENFAVYREIKESNTSSAEKMSRLDSEDLMQKNFLRLNIVFGQRGLETMNSTAAMTWEGLASNIGGTLTLYIGFTVMTFVELVELICRLGRLASISQNQVSEVGLRRPSSHATSV
jgi:hypothetical protein